MANGTNGYISEGVKRHFPGVTYATIATYFTLIPVLWFLAKPIIAEDIKGALGETITQEIREEVRPLAAAFRMILERDIIRVRRQINALQFKFQQSRQNTDLEWTLEDQQDLSDLQVQLQGLENALKAMEQRQ